jgi:hypothetical protein
MCHPPASGARGHRFESCRARRRKPRKLRGFAFLRTRYSWRAAIFAARPNGGQKLPRFCGRAEASTRLADGPVEGRTVLLALADEVTVDAGRRGLVVASHGRRIDRQSFRRRTTYQTPVLAHAAVAYRLFSSTGAPVTRIHWALRGSQNVPFSVASLVYAPTARPATAACFARRSVCRPRWRYRLAGGLASPLPTGLPAGRYRLTTYAEDWAGNRAARDTLIKVRQGHFLGAH